MIDRSWVGRVVVVVLLRTNSHLAGRKCQPAASFDWIRFMTFSFFKIVMVVGVIMGSWYQFSRMYSNLSCVLWFVIIYVFNSKVKGLRRTTPGQQSWHRKCHHPTLELVTVCCQLSHTKTQKKIGDSISSHTTRIKSWWLYVVIQLIITCYVTPARQKFLEFKFKIIVHEHT